MINIEACFLLSILCITLQVGIKCLPQYFFLFFSSFPKRKYKIYFFALLKYLMLPLLYFSRYLTLSWRRPISYRNQSIDLLCKPMDWFLYDIGLRHERVKHYQTWSFSSYKQKKNPYIWKLKILAPRIMVLNFSTFSEDVYCFRYGKHPSFHFHLHPPECPELSF